MTANVPSAGPYDLVFTRTFDASVETAWRAWTESEEVKKWWGPRGFSAPVARMDVKEGGTSLLCMRAPKEFGGQDFYNTWTYTTVVPHERLEFDLRFSDESGRAVDPATLQVPPGIPPIVHHVLTFRQVAPGKTEIRLVESGYTSTAPHEMSKAGMEQCLDKMAESFAAAGTR